MDTQNQSKQPDTEIIDRLFLELSQFTRAKTWKQTQLERALESIRDGAPNPQKIAADAIEVRPVKE